MNNSYEGNLAGARRSVVQVEGFPLFRSVNETYKQNENWFQEAYSRLSPLSSFGDTGDVSDAGNTGNTDQAYGPEELVNYPWKAHGILTVWRSLAATIEDTVFDQNYVVDDGAPHLWAGTPISSALNGQSNGLLLADFAGRLVIRGVAFQNNQGVSGSLVMSQYL